MSPVSRPIDSASFWLVAACVVLFLLQPSPMPGIYLMFFGSMFIEGFMIDFALFVIAFEALSGRISRWFVCIPLISCIVYYGTFMKQSIDVAVKSSEIQQHNEANHLVFDPSIAILVTPNAEEIVSHYAIPVVYSSDPSLPEGFRSYRLLAPPQCKAASKAIERLMALRIYGKIWIKFADDNDIQSSEYCILQIQESPKSTPIIVSRQVSKKGIFDIQHSHFSKKGETIATYETAYANRLPVFPFLVVGCMLVDEPPAWKCVADVWPASEPVDGSPNDPPAAVVLGLRKYSASDFTHLPFNSDITEQLRAINAYTPRDLR